MTTMDKDVITLGMFIIDDFEYRNDEGGLIKGRQEFDSQIGGGGTYTLIGSRIWLSPKLLGMIVDMGSDFPKEIHNTLNSYENEDSNMFIYRSDSDKETTRAVNIYTDQKREFEYLTPRHRLTLKDYSEIGLKRSPKYVHSVCSPQRQLDIINHSKALSWNPTFVYEPLPDSMLPENIETFIELLTKYSDNIIFSPNHTEASTLLGLNEPNNQIEVQKLTRNLHEKFSIKSLVLRCGKIGSYISVPSSGVTFWVDALHSKSQNIVKDVTGAGNAFLGGLIGGLEIHNGDICKASICGTISAGYTIEQDGLPRLNKVNGDEFWNDHKLTPSEEFIKFIEEH